MAVPGTSPSAPPQHLRQAVSTSGQEPIQLPFTIALVLYASVAFAIGFVDYAIRPYGDWAVTRYVPGVISGSYGPPAIYRVLVPFLLDWITRLTGGDPLIVFLVLRWAFIYGALLVTHTYLRLWYSTSASVAGTMAMAALLPLTFTNSYAHPDSFPELLLFTLGCLLIARRRDWLFVVVLVLAALNRETSIFLVLVWGCYRLPGRWARKDMAKFCGYVLAWVVVYAGMRWLRGLQHYRYWMLNDNIWFFIPLAAGFAPYKRLVGYYWLVLLGPGFWLAIRGARRTDVPLFLKRTLPVAFAFLVVGFTISTITETRIFLPMFPLLLPAAMASFCEPRPGP